MPKLKNWKWDIFGGFSNTVPYQKMKWYHCRRQICKLLALVNIGIQKLTSTCKHKLTMWQLECKLRESWPIRNSEFCDFVLQCNQMHSPDLRKLELQPLKKNKEVTPSEVTPSNATLSNVTPLNVKPFNVTPYLPKLHLWMLHLWMLHLCKLHLRHFIFGQLPTISSLRPFHLLDSTPSGWDVLALGSYNFGHLTFWGYTYEGSIVVTNILPPSEDKTFRSVTSEGVISEGVTYEYAISEGVRSWRCNVQELKLLNV